MVMTKDLAPIVARANATSKMRDIRKGLEELQKIPLEKRTWQHAAREQRLASKLLELKREYIFKIVDNG